VASGKAAHAVIVVGAWAQFDDPAKSTVVGKIGATLIPRSDDGQHASRAGHWIGAIARNVPEDRQRAALEFLKWFGQREQQLDYTRFGSVPVRLDLAQSELASDPKFRFLEAQVENSKVARMYAVVPEAAQLNNIISLRLNECVIGQSTPAQALNTAAAEVHEVVKRGGHRTGQLQDL
jgi:multiple sugar transport system substrate-binding protein